MEKSIIDLLTKERVADLARCWQAEGEAEVLDEVNNLVYAVDVAGKNRILRITHSSHRSRSEILSELDFIHFLAQRAVPVCRALPSVNGNLVETLPVEEGEFSAALFERAEGEFLKMSNPAHWNPAFLRHYGGVVGSMHAAARLYQPSAGIQPRHHWERDVYHSPASLIPAEEMDLAEEYERMVEKMRCLPCPPEGYGLVHNDINPTNFCIQNGRLKLFDFDDCCHNWFIHDLSTAIPMYYAPFYQEDWQEHTQQFLLPFLQGYRQEYALDAHWFSLLPDILRFQNASTLIFCYEDDIEHSQYAAFFHRVRQVFHEGHPLFNFDFESFYRKHVE